MVPCTSPAARRPCCIIGARSGALKLQRGHDRDLRDVRSSLDAKLIDVDELRRMFQQIETMLIRYPAIDPASFRAAVERFCNEFERR
jgi:hypothetical protein